MPGPLSITSSTASRSVVRVLSRISPAGGAVLDCVIQEIDDYLLEPESVAGDLDWPNRVAAHVDVLFIGKKSDLLGGRGDK